MRGELVVVRDFKGRGITVRVWSADEEAVYVTTDDGFASLQAGGELIPAGFRREDVFKYHNELARELEADEIDWSHLESWTG